MLLLIKVLLMKKENTGKNIAALLIGVIIISVLYVWVSRSNENLEENKRYTVGYFFEKSWSGGLILKYECYIDGEKHIGGGRYKEKGKYIKKNYDLLIGRRFFVKFSSKNYSNHELLINMPVPDTVRNVPPLGWDTIEFKKLFGEEK